VCVCRLSQKACSSLRPLGKRLHNKQSTSLNLTIFQYSKQEPQRVGKGPHQQHGPDRARRLLECLQVAAVGNDLRLLRGAGVKTLVFVVHQIQALVDDTL
jgi:hypothetical protein